MKAPFEPPRQVFTAPTGTRTLVLRLAVPLSAVVLLLVAVALVLAGTAGPSLPRLLGLPDPADNRGTQPTPPVASASPDDQPSREPASRSAARPTAPGGSADPVQLLAPTVTSAAQAPATTAPSAASTTAGVSPSMASSAPVARATSSPSGSGATNRATPTTRPTTRPTEPPGRTRTAPVQP